MGDRNRFSAFADLIARNFAADRYRIIADIAGGKGELQCCLRQKGFADVITFDNRNARRRLKNITYQKKLFNRNIEMEFDLLIGLHPDEATDVIISEAAKRKIPFIVCPCCIKPQAFPYHGQANYLAWVKHLQKLAESLNFKVKTTVLPIHGKNIVIIGQPG